MAAASDSRERERRLRAQVAAHSVTETSSAPPIFGAPVRVDRADDISQTIKQVLGSMQAVDTSHFPSLIGIPKQPQTPTVESAQSWRQNGAFPGQNRRNGEITPTGSSTKHSSAGSGHKTTPSKSSERRKGSQKGSRDREGSSKGGGSSSSSQKTNKGSRPSLDPSSQSSSQSSTKESRQERTSHSESSAQGKSRSSQSKLSPLDSTAGGTAPHAPRSKPGLSVELPSNSLRDYDSVSGIVAEEMESIKEEDATRLATHQSGDQSRPQSRSGQGSKDRKVRDILRIYTEHSAPRPISAICTPIKETVPKFPFEELPKKLDPIIDDPEGEGEEDVATDESDEKGHKEDNSEDEDEEDEENSSCDKTQEDTSLDMVKEEGAGGESSSGSEDEESQSSSEGESEDESESEDSSSNNRQAREPSPKPKSFSLQTQIQKVLKNSKKFTPTISDKSNSSSALAHLDQSDSKKEIQSPGPGSQEPAIDEQTEERMDEADDEEDEIEIPRSPIKEVKKPVSVGRGKTVPKAGRSSDAKKAPVKPSVKSGGSSQTEKGNSSQGKGAPSSGAKSFDAPKKGKDPKPPKVKVEKSGGDDGAAKKARTTSSSGKSASAKSSSAKSKAKKLKKEEKFPSKPYITSSDSEDEGGSRTLEHRKLKHKSPPTPTDHRTSSCNKGKSPLIRGGSRKDPKEQPPPLLSKVREKSSEPGHRRAPRKSISSSEDEAPHPVLSPAPPSVKREEMEEATSAPHLAPPSPPPPHATQGSTTTTIPIPVVSADLSFAKGDIPHLVVSFDLSLIRHLPIPREDRSKTLFGHPKRKDTLDTEKPSAIVKPYHTSKQSSDSRKEKISRTESRRPRTDSSSRSPRRMRDAPLPSLTEQPPVIEPPILPSDPSRTLDRRRSSSQSTDLSMRHEAPPPKRPRSSRLDSQGSGPQPSWTQGERDEGPEGMFGGEERLAEGLHRGAWGDEGFHQPGGGIFPNPSDCRRHSFAERQQFSTDGYLAEGKKLKHLADSQTDKYKQSLTYFEAALAFIMCGNNFEHDSNYPDEKAIKMYSDTCKIIQWLIGIHSGSDGRSNDKKLAVLCYRFQALLNMRIYTIKRSSTTELAKVLNDHFKSSKSSQRTQSSWNPSSKYSETPSPMSPTPSPAGSVGSVGSMGSQGSNHSTDIPPATTSSKVGLAGANGPGSGGTVVPQHIYNKMSTYMTNSTYCLTSIDFWEQADSLEQENRDFFQEVQEHCGVLTLHSSILELVQYSKYCLHKLKEL